MDSLVTPLPGSLAAPPLSLSVLLIEADTLARVSLGVLLTQGPYALQVVGLARSCAEAWAIWPMPAPELLLLAWPLAEPEGFPNVLHLLGQCPHAKMLILADDLADAHLPQLMAAGAAGCLTKDVDPRALPTILRSLQQGALIWPTVLPPGAYRRNEAGGPHTHLTARERDILLGVSQGLSNNVIAERLGLSSATVRTHVSRLLHKLGLNNRTQLALYAQRLPAQA